MEAGAIEEKRINQNEASMWAQLYTQVCPVRRSSLCLALGCLSQQQVRRAEG